MQIQKLNSIYNFQAKAKTANNKHPDKKHFSIGNVALFLVSWGALDYTAVKMFDSYDEKHCEIDFPELEQFKKESYIPIVSNFKKLSKIIKK